jgi:hypothetical protein
METWMRYIGAKGLTVMAVLALVTGCSLASGAPRLDGSLVTFAPEPRSGFEFRSLRAYQLPEGLFVKGALRRTDYKNTPTTASHVDLVLSEPGGQLIGEASIHHWPEVVTRYRSRRPSEFNVLFALTPSRPLVIHVADHSGPLHSVSKPIKYTESHALLFGLPLTGENP